ncbi:MAG: hypothetical protein Tsb0013_06080 [Phycisphaerales bacterium]
MATRDALFAAVAVALGATASFSQVPFFDSIGENAPPGTVAIEEIGEDLTLLRNAPPFPPDSIVHAGERIQQLAANPLITGLVVTTDVMGVPFVSWIIDVPFWMQERTTAVRQATIDNDLLLLHLTDQPANLRRIMTIKYDNVTGAQAYAWQWLGDGNFRPLGQELDGTTLVFAGAVRDDDGAFCDGLLVRYDQLTGLPLINNRYQPFAPGLADLSFCDVDIADEDGAIYAVGRIFQTTPGGIVGDRIVIAKFDAQGNVLWINGYLALLPGEQFREGEGVSIEALPQGPVAITARTIGEAGVQAFAMIVDPIAGAPIVSRFYGIAEQPMPAYASLDLLDQDTLLGSGFVTTPQGTPAAFMWGLDIPALSVKWFFEDTASNLSEGRDAIVQPNFGLPLTGLTDPIRPPFFGHAIDILSVRARGDGTGPCSLPVPPPELEALVEPFVIPVEQIQLPEPVMEFVEILPLFLYEQNICKDINDCLADFDMDGDVDLGDFGIFGAAFGSVIGSPNYNPAADLDNDGDVDLGDFGIFGSEFGRTDC